MKVNGVPSTACSAGAGGVDGFFQLFRNDGTGIFLPELAVKIGARERHTAVLDFGPGSVDGWLTGLVGEELGVREDDLLDRERRALILDGEEIPLTPLEYGLTEYLSALDGATATRDAILDGRREFGLGLVGNDCTRRDTILDTYSQHAHHDYLKQEVDDRYPSLINLSLHAGIVPEIQQLQLSQGFSAVQGILDGNQVSTNTRLS